jgi:hypothetical protein
VVTQRTQALHNALLGSCDTMIAHRLTAPADQEPVLKWLKANTSKAILEQVSGSLSSLKTGDGWIVLRRGEALRDRALPADHTYDNTATPTGDGDVREVKTAAVDQDKLRAIIGDAARLQQELTAAQQVKPQSAASIKTVEKPVLTDGDRALMGKLAAAIETTEKHAREALGAAESRAELKMQTAVAEYLNTTRNVGLDVAQELEKVLGRVGVQKILAKLSALSPQPSPTYPTTPHAQGSRTTPAASQGRRVAPAAATSRPASLPPNRVDMGDLTGPEFKILTSLAELEVLGLHPADKQQLGLMAGYTNVRSGGFSEPLGRLVAAGLIVSPRAGVVAITDDGRARAGAVEAPATKEELQDRILTKLTGPEQKLLRILIAQYPSEMSKEDLAAACDPPYANIRSGGFSEPLGHLNTLGLVESPQRGVVAAAPALFLEGR